MRTDGAAALFLGMCALCVCTLAAMRPALGQEACAGGADKLGMVRTFTVNAAGGAPLGAQYRNQAYVSDGEVVLTFDDGPSRAYTRPILDALAAQCTKATFFMVGRMALADPEMVREVQRRGHSVATHTWSHANLQQLPDEKAEAEIELGLSMVQRALGKPVAPLFRFPYLRDTPFTLDHLRTRQLATIGIDIDSRDFETRDAETVYERVIHDLAAKRKGIILFHDIHASTARALPRILAELKARGFRVVHLAAKTGVETMVEYDAMAEQEIERKRVAAAANPLAKRTIAWPATSVSEAQAPAKGQAAARTPSQPRQEDWAAKVWHQSR
jgi:peptidoglycan/xylan/chitin deacetylase (PgdA/CDA1 family)